MTIFSAFFTCVLLAGIAFGCTSQLSDGTCAACASPTTQYGPYCLPCRCVNGVCNGDVNGTGYCTSCTYPWRGSQCDRSLSFSQNGLEWAEAYSCAGIIAMFIFVCWVWITAVVDIKACEAEAAKEDEYDEPGIIYFESNTAEENRSGHTHAGNEGTENQDRLRPRSSSRGWEGERNIPAKKQWYQPEEAKTTQHEPYNSASPAATRASPQRHPSAPETVSDAVSHGRGPAALRADKHEPSRFSRGATVENGPMIEPPHQEPGTSPRSSPQRQAHQSQVNTPSQQNVFNTGHRATSFRSPYGRPYGRPVSPPRGPSSFSSPAPNRRETGDSGSHRTDSVSQKYLRPKFAVGNLVRRNASQRRKDCNFGGSVGTVHCGETVCVNGVMRLKKNGLPRFTFTVEGGDGSPSYSDLEDLFELDSDDADN